MLENGLEMSLIFEVKFIKNSMRKQNFDRAKEEYQE